MSVELAESGTTARAASIGITPLALTIGAEVTGVDLRRPLPAQQVRDIRAALLKWKAVFFRDQHLDHAQHVAFSRQFGELTPAHAVYGGSDGEFPEIYTVDRDRKNKRYAGEYLFYPWSGWHTDVTPAINPPAVSILRGDEVPAAGGDTQWADMVAAYDALSPRMRTFIDDLRGIHYYGANAGTRTRKEYQDQVNRNRIVSEHPLVRVHPETGERSLYISPSFLHEIVDLTPTESNRLLAMLKEHAARPEFTVRFKWTPGSVAMWDNRSTTHMGPRDVINTDHPRVVHRTTLMGDVPVGVDGRPSTAIEGEPIRPI